MVLDLPVLGIIYRMFIFPGIKLLKRTPLGLRSGLRGLYWGRATGAERMRRG